jgi:hypothetical protein
MLQNLPRAAAASSLALLLAAILVPTPLAAGGSTLKTLHFYATETSFAYTAPDGKHPATPPANPKPGASFDETDVAYTGTFREHSHIATGSSHLHCLYQPAGRLDCHSQIAIDGSLILAHGNAHIAMTIVGGTAQFLHATGRITAEPAGNGVNATIVYRTNS